MTALTGYIYSRISVNSISDPGAPPLSVSHTPVTPTLPRVKALRYTERNDSQSTRSRRVLCSMTARLEEALGVLAEDLTRGDHVREGAPRGDVHDGEAGGVAGADDGALSLGHGVGVCVEGGGSSALVRRCRGDDKINDWVQLCVGSLTGAGVVLVDGGRETEAAGEEARGGVDAHDLRWEGGDRSSGSVIG